MASPIIVASGSCPGGTETDRSKPIIPDAATKELAILFPSPRKVSLNFSGFIPCSEIEKRSEIICVGCSRSVRAFITGTAELCTNS